MNAAQNLAVPLRIAAGILGGYVFAWGFISLSIALGVAARMKYADAQALSYLTVFLVYLAAFCWAFAEPRLSRVWSELVGGGLLMTGAGWMASGFLHR